MEIINSLWNAFFNALLWFSNIPLVCVLMAGGIYFCIRTRLVQRRLGEAIRTTLEKPDVKGSVSSLGALMVSTASRVGTGNIIGVSTAICLGGPGAVFWMWVCALIGGASAFVESTLAQIYKRRNPDGSCYGGPAYYIESALHCRPLAIIFSLALIFTYGISYNMLASYNLQSSFACFDFYQQNNFTCWFIGAAIALLFGLCVMGGGKWVIRSTTLLVPIMGISYIGVAIIAMCINCTQLPGMFVEIFRSAFDFKSIFSGFMGSVIMLGMKRGLYSNEAGMGSAPNAAAAAVVSHPAKQGLVQMLSVFIDTLIICSTTAFMCLCSTAEIAAADAGAPYVQKAMTTTFGSFGPVFIAVTMVLFAFTTLLGNFYYAENCLKYFSRKPLNRGILILFRVAGALLVFAGAGFAMDLVWSLADIAQAILTFINIPVCVIIGTYAYRALDDYLAQRKAGKKPQFKAADIGLTTPTDFWK
jgi:AGCS family alanine or glycine:cation symporter